MRDLLGIVWHFVRARYFLRFRSRKKLLVWQQKQIEKFLQRQLVLAPYYRSWVGMPLASLPVVEKGTVMANFGAMNTAGVQYEEAMRVALDAESSRDFSPMLRDITIGLSSGTSGNRGIFMATARERNCWAGVLLARLLPTDMFMQILTPWRAPVRIAFFLRANSNIYTTLSSRRIDFVFYDLMAGLEGSWASLQHQQPDILVAPANVLKMLAQWKLEMRLSIQPQYIVSVAEVLERDDALTIERAFATKPMQIYQATEGFLGYSCEYGAIHLNEAFVHVEPEWIDDACTRFQPIITDFTRRTQMVVRYRLNDILRLAPAPCPCGHSELALESVEGRMDDTLWLPALNASGLKPVFPDFIRRAMLFAGDMIQDYRVIQKQSVLAVELKTDQPQRAQEEVSLQLTQLWDQQQVAALPIEFACWQPSVAGRKRRRVYCEAKPHRNITRDN